MSNKLFKKLQNDLNSNISKDLQQNLEMVHNKKFVFTFNLISLLLLIVIIYNSISSALLGLPPLSMVAMIDHSGSILMFLERVALGIVAVITTVPFFNMLVFDKLGKNLSNSEITNRNAKIRNSNVITETMDAINGTLIAIAIIAAGYFIAQAITISLSFLLIAAASISAIYILQKIIHQVVIEYHLCNHSPGDLGSINKPTDQSMLIQFFTFLGAKEEKTEKEITIELVETAVKKLSYVSFSTVSNEEVYQALVTNLYQEQLARALKAYAETGDKGVNEIKLAAAESGIYSKLACIDDQVEASAVYTTYTELLANKDTDEGKENILAVIRAKHAFRNNMRNFSDKGTLFKNLLKEGADIESILGKEISEHLSKHIDPINDSIQKAILAEIAEEQILLYSDISVELQTKLFKERLIARDELDDEIAKTLDIEVHHKGLAVKIGSYIGNINALVNGVIIAAVTSNILSSILPGILLGFAVANPIALYIIMAVAFASGWYASFSITKDAVENICKNIDNIWYKQRILDSKNQNYNNLSYGANCTILLAAVGVGILTGIQVFHMLLPIGLMIAIISSIFIASMTVMAGGSLFIKFIDGSVQKEKQRETFLELHFKGEYEQQNKAARAENISYVISIALGIAATVLILNNMHIFAFAVLTGMTTFLIAEIFATAIVNKHCVDKPASNGHIAREICGKVAIFATALCAMCFFTSTFVTITALVAGNVGIILAITTALCIAYLYSQYVWSAGASPDVYWQKSLPRIQHDAPEVNQTDTLPKKGLVVASSVTMTQDNKANSDDKQNKDSTNTGTNFSLLGCLGWK